MKDIAPLWQIELIKLQAYFSILNVKILTQELNHKSTSPLESHNNLSSG